MARVTQYRTDPDLVELLVKQQLRDARSGCASKGVRFIPIYGRQAFKVDGKFKFWGGLTVEAVGGGPGLVEHAHRRGARSTASRSATPRARSILLVRRRRRRRRARAPRRQDRANCAPRPWCSPAAASRPTPNGARAISAPAGISPRCAARASTPATASAWRSTSAPSPYGNWSGCHAVRGTCNAPEFGDLAVGDQFQKHCYPFGIMVNADGKRFVDEGADFRNYTYAKYGRVILEQPGQFAWQIFDQQGDAPAARRIPHPQVTKVTANSLEELAQKLEGVNAAAFLDDDQGLQRGGAHRRAVQSQRQGRALHRRASRSTRATGRTRSTRRRSRPTR